MQLRNAKVFVTGGAGFIGSHLVPALLDRGADVTVFDDFSSGRVEHLDGLDIRVVRGTILDRDALSAAMAGHDAVVHQAAQLEITRAIDSPLYDLETNTIGSLNVLGAMVKHGIATFVEASSAAVYGQATSALQHEDDAHNPNWEYGVSKLAAEKYAAIYAERAQMSSFSLRYGIVYGEREWFGRVLTIFLKRALSGLPPVVFGAGDQIRDFTYVGDIASLNLACLESGLVGHYPLNGSTGVGTSVADLAELIRDVCGVAAPTIFENVAPGGRSELVEGERMRLPSELMVMCMSPTKAASLLGWTPQVALRDGLEREWKWLADHVDRWTRMSY
jgi:UDP-glucose 4-epimerase